MLVKLSKKFSIIILSIFTVILVFLSSFFIVEIGGYGAILNKVKQYSKSENLSPQLVLAIIKTESNFNKNAVSYKGAVGLMQLTKNTANYIAKITNFNGEIDLFNEDTNLILGIKYLRYLSNKFSDINAVICAYNAGETKVREWLDSSGNLVKNKVEYKETFNFLTKVKRRQSIYKVLVN